MRRWLIPIALLALAATAQAETRVPLLLRDKPSASSRVAAKLPVGSSVLVAGQSRDGAWFKVVAGKHVGWVLAAALREADPSATALVLPTTPAPSGGTLAAPHKVRPEVWVAESRYHDGQGPAKVKVVTPRADLFARPTDGAQAIAMVKRGDQLVVVRASRDGRWYLVELGAGEVGWIASSSVTVLGAAPLAPQVSPADSGTATPTPVTPPPASPAPPTVAAAPPPAPVQVTPPPEQPPPVEKPSRRRRGARAAATPSIPVLEDNEPAGGAPATATTGTTPTEEVTATAPATGLPRYQLHAAAGLGWTSLDQHFTSNAHGNLSNYDASTGAFGIEAVLGGWLRLGERWQLGLDFAYRYAGAAGLAYTTSDGSSITLGVAAHTLAPEVGVGYLVAPSLGLSLGLRVGAVVQVDLVEQNAKALLPSDRVVGLVGGVRLEATQLYKGLRAALEASFLLVGTRDETAGIDDGHDAGTTGYSLAAQLGYAARPDVLVGAGVRWSDYGTDYSGKAARNPAITSAHRDTSLLGITVGVTYVR